MNQVENVLFKHALLKNAALKDKYLGKECYIFLTGPAVNDINLKKLKNRHTFICNHFYRHNDVSEMNPTFFSHIENVHKTMRYSNKSEQSITIINNMLEKCQNVTFILNRSALFYIKKLNIANAHFFASKNKTFDENTCIDFTKRSPFLIGTVYFLLALSIFLGFKKIYLLGAGYTLEPYQWLHFYDDQNVEFPNELKQKKPEKEHDIIKKIAIKNGVQIINVIPQGYKSPIYDSMHIDEFNNLI